MHSLISLGAGVQSSTLALMVVKGLFPQYKVKGAIFADTQAEPKKVYEYLRFLETQLTFPLYRVTAGSLREDSLILRRSKKTDYIYLRTLIPMYTQNADGSRGRLIRKCTRDYKIVPIQRKIRELIGRKKLNRFRREYRAWEKTGEGDPPRPLIRQLIGISYDEVERMKQSRDLHVKNEYPLVNLKMTRQDCLDWMEENGYPRPPRSACTFCPFHSNEEWARVKEDKEEWERVVAFERYQQRLQAIDQRLEGQIFLHPSCKPIDEIDFGPNPDKSEDISDWNSECEGMCGL